LPRLSERTATIRSSRSWNRTSSSCPAAWSPRRARSTRISVSDGFLLTLISSPVGKPSEMSESGDTGPGIFLINSIEPQEAGAEAVGCLMSGDEQSDKRNFIIRDR